MYQWSKCSGCGHGNRCTSKKYVPFRGEVDRNGYFRNQIGQAKILSKGMNIDYYAFPTETIDEALVLKYNPQWSGAGETIRPIDIPDCYKEKFELVYHEEYPLKVHFTRESWNGRMKAC